MDIEGQRRSSKFEDRGSGGRGGGGGVPINALSSLVRLLGVKGAAIVGVRGAGVYFLAPPSVKQALLSALSGGAQGRARARRGRAAPARPRPPTTRPAISRAPCSPPPKTCGRPSFSKGRCHATAARRAPTRTRRWWSSPTACRPAVAATPPRTSGPFYCPGDHKLYIDPTFYDVMEQRLKAPGDFAQAYVIAHEVGHHVQNLIGSTKLKPAGETKNQMSVRVELQADCLAGVWGHTARASLKINDDDLKEAVTAAHAIGDDALGHSSSSDYTHGSSAQRIRWFRRGFDSGDPRQCDTFAVTKYAEL